MEEVTCFRLCHPRPQVTRHKNKQTRACPRGTAGGERERAVLTSRWSALECPVLAHIARDIPTPTNRAQLSHATNLPILTANRRVGEGKGGRRVLHCCHPRCPQSGTINIIILGRSSAGQRAETGNTDQTITSLKNKQVLTKESPTEIQQTRGHGKSQKRKKKQHQAA